MNITHAIESLDYLFRAQLTPFFWGHAGIGKTSIVKQYAEQKGYKFFALYLGTQSDVGDILGLASFIKDENGQDVATRFATPEWLKGLIDYCEANPTSGGVLFLDEFNRGRRDILAGMFALALDKTFHTIRLPKNLHVVAAGNPPTDEYNVTDINETALMARFFHAKLEPTFDEWLKYAQSNGMDASLTGFLKQQPELLEQKHTEFQLPVKVDRRAYERLDRLFKLKTPAHLMENLMAGIIGLERTVAYQNYMRSADKPLTGEEVLDGSHMERVVLWSNPDNTLSSLINLTCDNVKEVILAKKKNMKDAQKKYLFAFMEAIPKDIMFNLLSTLVKSRNEIFADFFKDPNYADKLVDMAKTAVGKEKKDDKEEKKTA